MASADRTHNVRIGTRVGLAVLATDRSLHLYVDGTERGVVAPDVPDPCCFMFDMGFYCSKVLHWFCQFLSRFVLLFTVFSFSHTGTSPIKLQAQCRSHVTHTHSVTQCVTHMHTHTQCFTIFPISCNEQCMQPHLCNV